LVSHVRGLLNGSQNKYIDRIWAITRERNTKTERRTGEREKKTDDDIDENMDINSKTKNARRRNTSNALSAPRCLICVHVRM
jgi:hypothetical protein